tara:strand:- start:1482 stop:2507 length:1026 start_codon:yes stop_codon:yes gene_type:complete
MTDKTLIHINLASGFGGGEVQTLNLIANLSGFRQLILGKKDKPFTLKAKESFSQSHSIKVASFWSVVYTAMMSKEVLIHAHDGRGAHLARLIGWLTGKPYLISRRVDKALKGKASTKTYQKAAALVAVSQKVADNIRHLNSHVSIVHDSYSNLPSDRAVDKKLTELKSKFVVTQLGSLLEVKNIPFTIELAKQIEHTHPGIHFLIVGKGKEEASLKQLANGLSNITFFGFTPYVGSVLKRTDVLMMPSNSEGLGSAVLEAYQHDTPVITSKVGGLPEIVEHGTTGYLVDTDSCEQAKQYLVDLVSSKDLYQQIQQNIQQKKQQYSPESMAERYIACYDQVW